MKKGLYVIAIVAALNGVAHVVQFRHGTHSPLWFVLDFATAGLFLIHARRAK
jgi:hypothetical protein